MERSLTRNLIRSIFRKSNVIKPRYSWSMYRCLVHSDGETESRPSNISNLSHGEIKSYKDFLNRVKMDSNTAVTTLMRILDVTEENAKNVVDNWKIFTTLTVMTLMENNELLREAGALKSTLRENMYALADTTPNIRKKIAVLQSTQLEINSAIPLFQLPVKTLEKFSYIAKQDRKHLGDHPNRISYLSSRLNEDIYSVCIGICNAPYMLKKSITKMIGVTEYLLETDLVQRDIMKDMKIYQYSLATIKSRCGYAKSIGLTNIKPWIVRCPERLYESIIARTQLRLSLQPPEMSINEYIQNQLGCDEKSVKTLITRDPSIRKIGIEKLTAVLHRLRDYGYSVMDIYRAPRALHTRPETITRRYNIWRQFNNDNPPLFTLVLSENTFNEQLKRHSQDGK